MNKDRRSQINIGQEKLEDAKAIFESVRDEEQEAFDNLMESLQKSEKGQAIEENVQALQEIIDSIDAAIDAIGGIN